jgi:hypothetical protein
MENGMTLLRKAAMSLTAASILLSPIAASAAPAFDGARASSSVSGENELGGNASWIIGLIGLVAGVTAAILITNDDKDDFPVSP